MSLLSKIRGLWRFDGNEDPADVGLTRRRFLFLGAAAGSLVAAGASLPTILMPGDGGWGGLSGASFQPVPYPLDYDSFLATTIRNYQKAFTENFLADRPVVALLMEDLGKTGSRRKPCR